MKSKSIRHLLDDAILDVDILLQNAVVVHHAAALDEQSLLRALCGEIEGLAIEALGSS